MAAPFSIEGYVKSVKVIPVGNYQKAYITVSSLRKRPDKEGNKQYDSLTIQCFVHGVPSFEEGSYIVANGELQSYKDQNEAMQTVLFAESVGVDPAKFRAPKDKPQQQTCSNANNGGAPQRQPSGYSRPAPQSAPAPRPQAEAPKQSAGYRRPEPEPKPYDPSTAQGPELFEDTNIPF